MKNYKHIYLCSCAIIPLFAFWAIINIFACYLSTDEETLFFS